MAVITVNVAGYGTVTVTGTKPFAKSSVTGHPTAGTFKLVDASGADAKLATPQGTNVVFANTKAANTEADAIVAAVNA